MFAVGEDGKYDDAGPIDLRVDGMVAVDAKVLAQNGNVLGLIPVTLSTDSEDIMLDEDGTITAVAVTKEDKEAVIKAESADAGLSATLKVSVTKPIDAITLDPDEAFLAVGEEVKVTAQAMAGDDSIRPLSMSDWEWTSDDTSVAKVKKDVTKSGDKETINHNLGVITGVSTGVTTITVSAEGVTATIEVTVTGQRVTRRIEASNSNNGNTFTWDRGRMDNEVLTPGWTGDTASSDAITASTEFDVDLYDAISHDRLNFQATGDITISNSNTGDSGVTATPVSVSGGTITVTVTPPTVPDGLAQGTYQSILTIRTTGANPIKVRFTLVVKDAPTS